MKGRGEKERYTHLNAEFQRIARRNKKDFFGVQCKEIGWKIKKEWKRLEISSEKKKIRDTKGTFHAKMGIKRPEIVWTYQKQNLLGRGGKKTQKNYTKKIFFTQIIMMV